MANSRIDTQGTAKLRKEELTVSGGANGDFVHVLFAVVLASAALYFARVVLEPIAFALFGMALVWPLQQNAKPN